MIRVPLVILFYLFLWGLNLFFLDQSNLQYCNVLGIKSGIAYDKFFVADSSIRSYFIHSLFSHILFDSLYSTLVISSWNIRNSNRNNFNWILCSCFLLISLLLSWRRKPVFIFHNVISHPLIDHTFIVS